MITAVFVTGFPIRQPYRRIDADWSGCSFFSAKKLIWRRPEDGTFPKLDLNPPLSAGSILNIQGLKPIIVSSLIDVNDLLTVAPDLLTAVLGSFERTKLSNSFTKQ